MSKSTSAFAGFDKAKLPESRVSTVISEGRLDVSNIAMTNNAMFQNMQNTKLRMSLEPDETISMSAIRQVVSGNPTSSKGGFEPTDLQNAIYMRDFNKVYHLLDNPRYNIPSDILDYTIATYHSDRNNNHNSIPLDFIKHLLELPNIIPTIITLQHSIHQNLPDVTKLVARYIKNSPQIVLSLIEKYANVGMYGYTQKDITDLTDYFYKELFKYALENKDYNLARSLISDPNINIDISLGLVTATGRCHDTPIDIVESLLVDPRVDPSYCNNIALDNSIIHNCPDVTKLLVKHIKNGSTIGLNMLTTRYTKKSLNQTYEEFMDLFRYFLNDPQCDPSFEDNSILGMAVIRGLKEAVKLLLNDPRIPNINSINILLHIAVHVNDVEMVEILLDSKKMTSNIYRNGKVCLEMANSKNYTEIVGLLLHDFRIIMPSDMFNKACLVTAIETGNIEIIIDILADPDAVISPAFNGLFLAVEQNQYDALCLLLEDGRIDPLESNKEGRSLLAVAKQYVDDPIRLKIVKKLESHIFRKLLQAIENKDVEEANRLLDHPDIDPSRNDNKILHDISVKNYLGIDFAKRVLEDPRVKITPERGSHLIFNTTYNQHELIELFIDNIKDGLHYAIRHVLLLSRDNDLLKEYLSRDDCDPSFNDNEFIKTTLSDPMSTTVEAFTMLLDNPKIKISAADKPMLLKELYSDHSCKSHDDMKKIINTHPKLNPVSEDYMIKAKL